ncbi:MAG: RNA-dependent DNA polymerase [Chloroflexi bacterium]|nr:RNA-dependent DNA polymerase [Chloroflexota bacterium]
MYDTLLSWDNLLRAYYKGAKTKRGKPNVAVFEHRLEENLFRLQEELAAKTYRPGQYASFLIHEPKRRLISAAPFRDRVVHHALCNLIEPVFERSFITDSYANRVGKGTHRAVTRCQQFARRYPYVLQCDARQFFPSIDHAILRDVLARKLNDPDVMWLVDQIINSGSGVLTAEYEMAWFPADNLLAASRPRGLPIGNLTSQFWGNCYLNPFDHFVKQELGCKGYVRFVDDFMLFADNKRQLWQWKKAITGRLAALRLTIHPQAQVKPTTQGLPFLGFVIYPERRCLKRRKGIHFQRRLQRLIEQYADGQLSLAQLEASIKGWINHTRYANTVGLRKAVITKTVIPKQKK